MKFTKPESCYMETGYDLIDFTCKYGAPSKQNFDKVIKVVMNLDEELTQGTMDVDIGDGGERVFVTIDAVENLKQMDPTDILTHIYEVQRKNDRLAIALMIIAAALGLLIGHII